MTPPESAENWAVVFERPGGGHERLFFTEREEAEETARNIAGDGGRVGLFRRGWNRPVLAWAGGEPQSGSELYYTPPAKE